MKSFKEIAREYQLIDEAAKFKKEKKWSTDKNGDIKKVMKKACVDADGKKVPGYKLVDGNKCVKMTPAEIKLRQKTAKKSMKTKVRHSSQIQRRAEKIRNKKIGKGLIADPNKEL